MQPEKSGSPGTAAAFAWREGFVLHPPATARQATPDPIRYRLHALPGEVLPTQTESDWSFSLGVEAGWRLQVDRSSEGFRLASVDGLDEAIVMCRPGGTLAGVCRGRCAPRILSPTARVETSEDVVLLSAGDCARACLIRIPQPDGGMRFVLAAGSSSRVELETAARLQTGFDVATAWRAHWQPREQARELLGSQAAGCEQDLEQLCEAIHPAGDSSSTRWMQSGDAGAPMLHVDATLSGVLAWQHLERAVACELVASALACGHDEGWIPARTRPDRPGSDQYRAWPCLAIAADLLNPSVQEWARWQRPLHRHLSWWATHWPRRRDEPDAVAAFELDPSLPAVRRGALAALLAAEGTAFLDRARRDGSAADNWRTLHQACNDWRLEALACLAEGQGATPDEQACWRLFIARAGSTAGLPPASFAPAGTLSPMATALHLVCSQSEEPRNTTSLPEPPAGTTIEAVAVRLAIVFRAAGRKSKTSGEPSPVPRQGTRARLAAVGAALLLAALAFVIIRTTMHSAEPTPGASETQLGLATRLYTEERYNEALTAFERVRGDERDTAQFEMQIGNTHFRLQRYAEAETHYRKAIARDPKAPAPALNLALALFRQGRRDAALAEYGTFIERFGATFPDLRQRAELARAILVDRAPAG